MVLAVVLAFLLGVGAGFVYGRSRPAVGTRGRADVAAIAPLARGRDGAPSVPAPNRKARKAGLTDADFKPSDDILDQLRKAEAGQLDPAELPVADPTPDAEEPTAPLDPSALTDAERRVLDRLRRTEGEPPAM